MIIKDSTIGNVEMDSNESIKFENCFFKKTFTMTKDSKVVKP